LVLDAVVGGCADEKGLYVVVAVDAGRAEALDLV